LEVVYDGIRAQSCFTMAMYVSTAVATTASSPQGGLWSEREEMSVEAPSTEG